MYVSKIKMAALILLAIGLVGGAGWFGYRSWAGGGPGVPLAKAPLPEEAPKPMNNQPNSSEPVEKNGLSMRVRPDSAVFSEKEPLAFTITFKNESKGAFLLFDLDWPNRYDFTFTNLTAGGAECTAVFPDSKRRPPEAGDSRKLEPGASRDVKFSMSSVNYRTKGDAAKQGIIRVLPRGKYRVTVTVTISRNPALKDGARLELLDQWNGTLTSKPVEFEIGDQAARVASKAVRVNAVDFEAVADRFWAIPAAGQETPVNLGLRLTNHTDKDLSFNLFDTILPRFETADGQQRWVGEAERSATRPAEPVSIPARKSVTLSRPAVLKWSEDGKTLLLVGGDGSGGTWIMGELRPGMHRLSFNYDNKEQKVKFFNNAQPFWVGVADSAAAEVEIGRPLAAAAAADDKRSPVTGSLMIHSGLPNPEWQVSEAALKSVRDLLKDLAPAKKTDMGPGLGGVRLWNRRQPNFPDEVWVNRGFLEISNGDKVEYFQAPKDLEKLLLEDFAKTTKDDKLKKRVLDFIESKK
jgi:hypothetical protein